MVLVPASQEAEPLDITVTLHPRAAHAQPHGKALTSVSLPRCYKEKKSEVSAPPVTHPPSPGGALEPPSPSSIGGNSAVASRCGRGSVGDQPGGAACAGARVDPIASSGAVESRSRGGPSGAQQQPARKGPAITAPQDVEGEEVKRRGGLKIPGAGKVRLSRSGSVTPAKPPALDARHIASWDGSQDMVPVASPGTERQSRLPGHVGGEGEAIASPTGERGREAGGIGPAPAGVDGEDGGGGGSGKFASLPRRLIGERLGGDGLSKKPPNVPAPLSARERSANDKGRNAGVVRGGLSSAPADTQASYKMFFGDTDDGGEESGSSGDDEDGLRPRKSFIRVSCTARTSYKLFSSDPQVFLRLGRVLVSEGTWSLNLVNTGKSCFGIECGTRGGTVHSASWLDTPGIGSLCVDGRMKRRNQ